MRSGSAHYSTPMCRHLIKFLDILLIVFDFNRITILHNAAFDSQSLDLTLECLIISGAHSLLPKERHTIMTGNDQVWGDYGYSD